MHHQAPAPSPAHAPVPPFDQLLPELQRTLAEELYHTPTPIQAQAIPHLLAGRDLIGCAQTGTGKTAAFTLPLLQYLLKNPRTPQPGHPRALVLAPTRELAAQIGDSVATYGRGLRVRHAVIFGGVGQNPQIQAARRGLDILVATPGRLIDLMNQGHINLKQVEVVILDEADRMLDMGFIPDIRRIISRIPPARQSLLFSATMAPEIRELAQSFVRDPVTVTIAPEKPAVERIVQKIMFVDKGNKPTLLAKLLTDANLDKVIVFTRTKHGADKVAKKLQQSGITVAAIHGNKGQGARTSALAGFRDGRVRVLVATDIAARGLDVDGITHVINFDLPNEPETYVHRIGRTARAGEDGDAVSFCSAEERDDLRAIEKLLRHPIPVDTGHGYHDSNAQHATGDAARRPPQGNRGGNRGGQRGGGGHRPAQGGGKPAGKVGFSFRSRHRN
ncbi:MAG TPA: DEAD/DEAH box helicase [Kiritimatiellia bacterium]|nr:DEAD/DEAH box helicase [Kiritimatiellia bacterium]